MRIQALFVSKLSDQWTNPAAVSGSAVGSVNVKWQKSLTTKNPDGYRSYKLLDEQNSLAE